MSKEDSGGPAFPAVAVGTSLPWNTMQGLSIRDYFAGQALAGLLASPNIRDGAQPNLAAQAAYIVADAMLKQRQERE